MSIDICPANEGPLKYIVDYPAVAPPAHILWACMDDRPLSADGLLYRQIGGGLHGAATDLLVMSELMRPGIFLNTADDGTNAYLRTQSPNTIPGLTRTAHQALIQAGILACLHDYCAGEGSAPDVNTNVTNFHNNGTLLPRVRELFPGFDRGVYEEDIALRGVLARQGVFRGSCEGVTRFSLVNMSHVATTIIANHRPNTAFNPYAAVGPNPDAPLDPAYHISFGDMPELFEPLLDANRVTADPRTMRTVSAVRHAALSLMLPNQPLSIIYNADNADT